MQSIMSQRYKSGCEKRKERQKKLKENARGRRTLENLGFITLSKSQQLVNFLIFVRELLMNTLFQ